MERRSGHNRQRGSHDHRNPYERDKTRVIHCSAFRRLQRKTQILGTSQGDFHRTRLTHSLEVASIGSSIVHHISRQSETTINPLLPKDDLIQVICLLHDIGHPPFGHGGEVALNFMMRDHGGFEGNAQTLRLLTKTENSYGPFGLDLTRRSLLGILKYPVNRSKVLAPERPILQNTLNKAIKINDWLPPKAYYDSEQPEVDWILKPFHQEEAALLQSLEIPPRGRQHGKTSWQGFDCSIMNIADDIAYGVHDLEDAIQLKLIQREHLDTETFRNLLSATDLAQESAYLTDLLFDKNPYRRKQAIGEMVNYFITRTTITTTHPDFTDNLLKYNLTLHPEADALLEYLKQCISSHVIDSPEARVFEHGGQMVVLGLFEAIGSNPQSLLDLAGRDLYQQVAGEEHAAQRVICDYIANMTDEYAYRMHERLFGFNTRVIFERM